MQEAVVSQAVEAARQGVLQVAADELHAADLHGIVLSALAVLDRDGDRPVVAVEYPGIGYGSLEEVLA